MLATLENLSDDIIMEFGLDKCAEAFFKRGKWVHTTTTKVE